MEENEVIEIGVDSLRAPEAAEALLQNMTEAIHSAIEAEVNLGDVMAKLARKYAKDLLDDGGWNSPSMLGRFLMEWFSGSNPHECAELCLMQFGLEYVRILQYAGMAGVLQEQWAPQLEELFGRYVGYLIGVIPESLEDDEVATLPADAS